jgi:hypothetical protein
MACEKIMRLLRALAEACHGWGAIVTGVASIVPLALGIGNPDNKWWFLFAYLCLLASCVRLVWKNLKSSLRLLIAEIINKRKTGLDLCPTGSELRFLNDTLTEIKSVWVDKAHNLPSEKREAITQWIKNAQKYLDDETVPSASFHFMETSYEPPPRTTDESHRQFISRWLDSILNEISSYD